ncbi:hypothetical protein HYV81_03680 [Candidatus Woesearchaeota archaeon]|nr:hypothetical protein [Candidatus Woesearchaeota archaeon]
MERELLWKKIKDILQSYELQVEDLIAKAFERDQPIWEFELKTRRGYVYIIKNNYWRSNPIEHNSDEWFYFHKYSVKEPEYILKMGGGKYFRVFLCLDFLRKVDLILVAIFYDNVEEQKPRRKNTEKIKNK